MRRSVARLDAVFQVRYVDDTFPTTHLEGENFMSVDTSDGHEAMDYKEHMRTYEGFLKGSVTLVVLVAVILFGMLIFLV